MADIHFHLSPPPAVFLGSPRGAGPLVATLTSVIPPGYEEWFDLPPEPPRHWTVAAPSPAGTLSIHARPAFRAWLGAVSVGDWLVAYACPSWLRAGQSIECRVRGLHQADGQAFGGEMGSSLRWGPREGSAPGLLEARESCRCDGLPGATLARLFWEVISHQGEGRPTSSPALRALERWFAGGRGRPFWRVAETLSGLAAEVSHGQGLLMTADGTYRLSQVELLRRPSEHSRRLEVVIQATVGDGPPLGVDLRTLHRELAHALAQVREVQEAARALDADCLEDSALLKKLSQNPLHGAGVDSAFSVLRQTLTNPRDGAAKCLSEELWLCYRLPLFLLEAERGFILDYSSPSSAASVAVRLAEDETYPSLFCHPLVLWPHDRSSKRAWSRYPNVSGGQLEFDSWPVCCADGPQRVVRAAMANGLSVGQYLRALLQAGHDAVLLGHRAGNGNNLHHHPWKVVAQAEAEGKPAPYRLLSRAEAEEKRRAGALWIPYDR